MRKSLPTAVGTAILTALLCGCGTLPRAVPTAVPRDFLPAPSQPRAGGRVIGVLLAGWHTGLILPVSELGPLRALLPIHPGARYVSFGWGNRRFYMAAHPTFSDAVAALFSSPSAVLVTTAPTVESLLPSGGTYRWLCADRKEIWRIDAYLMDALRQRGGKPEDLGAGPWPGSEFLASGERYDAFHTCNTWTARALEVAGLAVHAGDVIFASQLKARIRQLPVCRHRALTAG